MECGGTVGALEKVIVCRSEAPFIRTYSQFKKNKDLQEADTDIFPSIKL